MYKALSRELFIGNVYLRVYNDQPDSEISEPETFCIALIDFISYLVHNQSVGDADVNDIVDATASHHTYEDQNETVEDGSVSEQHELDSSTAESNGQVAEKEEIEQIKNLRSALTSLQVNCLIVSLYVKMHYV